MTDAVEKKGKEFSLRFEHIRSVCVILLMKDFINQTVPLTILSFNKVISSASLLNFRPNTVLDPSLSYPMRP
jgi:hypothetical protein